MKSPEITFAVWSQSWESMFHTLLECDANPANAAIMSVSLTACLVVQGSLSFTRCLNIWKIIMLKDIGLMRLIIGAITGSNISQAAAEGLRASEAPKLRCVAVLP